MAKLGTEKEPAVVRVQTESRAAEIAEVFENNGWIFILGIEPDKPEDVSDLEISTEGPLPLKKLNAVWPILARPPGI